MLRGRSAADEERMWLEGTHPHYDAVREAVCDYAGHDWQDAGGGMLICGECRAEKWEDEDDR